jgi:apolipoprotein N-acyltransferase
VAFGVFLLMERHIAEGKYKWPYWTFYKYAYVTLLLWNVSTGWWVYHTTLVGGIFILLANSLFMSFPLVLFQFTCRRQVRIVGYLSLLTYWVSMEYLHLQWELSLPWFNLGNCFACWPQWVQWYEYTGTLGGTVWVVVGSILFFLALYSKKRVQRRRLLGIGGCWIFLPVLYSYGRYIGYQDQGNEVEIVVMQPSIDPASEKFIDSDEVLSIEERLERFMQLSETQLTSQTQFLVWPESAIDLLFDEQLLREYPIIDRLVSFRQKYPQLSVLTGIRSLAGYGNEKATKTARWSNRRGYYDVFNTALFINNHDALSTYHKSKLVVGGELIPYIYTVQIPPSWNLPKVLGVPGLGATLGSVGTQEHPTVFFNTAGIGVAPVICYESIFGNHVAGFIRKGPSFIFSITIDGWWKKTPGYQQHFHYIRLRAIENRRSVARSALKGISGFINQRGDILQAIDYDDQTALRHTVRANTSLTFYTKHGDYLGKWAPWAALLLLMWALLGSRLATRVRKGYKRGAASTKERL